MKYALVDITTLEFSIKALPDLDLEQQIVIDFGHQFIFGPEISFVQLILNFQFKIDNVNIAKITTGFAFHFEALVEVIIPDENGLQIVRKDVQRQLYAVGVGTTRGIFHAKTEGNKGTRLFIPVINPNEQIKD